ncbi:VOC family protein [Paenibacillus chartarius]|uniref:VOC family protein n=1 Tax=Paenibacillus chartarius TaxID=747481 RepID=A0ABV6DHZ3_9BACL
MNEQIIPKEQSIFSRVGYIHYPTKDFDRSVAWYTDILGFRLRTILDQGVSRSPEEREAIFNFGDPASPHNVAFLLIERGVEVGDIIGNHEAKSFLFKDPDGNVLEAAWSIWD